jgi:predicted enzyme involved in methoxymalonyl-ACP biosynthesis
LISSVILERKDSETLFIDTWIMSCRVLKRNVEELTLNKVVTLAKESGCKRIIGEYIPTPKNGIVKDFFSNFGFLPTNEGLWFLDTQEYTDKKTFIKINCD